MIDSIKQGSVVLLRAVIKAATGFIIVPMGLFVNAAQDGFEAAGLTVKFFTGILLIPMVGFLLIAAPWWEDFDIVD